MEEIWKDIPGWEGIYKVSNTGFIASYDRIINGRKIKGRTLKKSISKKNTVKVNLCTGKSSKSMTYTVAYLVLLSFVSAPPDQKNIRALHVDGDPNNNILNNIYWGLHKPNSKERHNKKLLHIDISNGLTNN